MERIDELDWMEDKKPVKSHCSCLVILDNKEFREQYI